MSEISSQELDRILREVVKRTLVDANFRTKAIADGTSAVAEVAGKSISSHKFTFVENSGDTTTVVLPDAVAESDQLLDEDLEQVAGGVAPVEDPCNGSCGQGSCLHT